ncbi:P-loop containing nucleoside triphosphate hydrolase protein [Mycena galopus ATCC 62051]|nr:P-loop containing nucleoside triphosphate hydrolase protein [Mycena galopus ATCC 62051]
MVRRTDTSDEDETGSQSSPAPSKAENSKEKGKARQEEMSPKGAKRARANDDGDAVPNDEEEGTNDNEEHAPPPRRVKTLPRDTDGFIPGSILRIQLRNFVTYDFVEFSPGPYFNMILGPNGTGKSSIACAICIGLNWPPKILGRSKDLNSFVKIGADDGHIEIELKAPAGQPNLIIKRSLSATSKSSSFTLNGAGATGHEITERVARLNVQVGNLCSFLPQDKVSAFAAMSPVELLRETENAAGDERLKGWHTTLIEAGAQFKEITEKIKQETETMLQLTERNKNLERDVQRYRKRKQIEQAISLLRVLIPVQHFREARDTYLTLKARQKASHAKVTRLMNKNKPAQALLKKFENQATELYNDREAVKEGLRAVLQKFAKKTQESEALEAQSEDAQTALENLKRREKVRLANIKNAEAQIVQIKEEMEKQVVENEADVQAERRRVVAEFHASSYETEKHANHQKIGALADRKARNNTAKSDGENQLRDLDSIEARKLNNLTQWNRDAGDAVRWLRANSHQFRMEVFEPPVLSVTVPNYNFAAAVERCFSQAQIKMFVCQCQEDYELLNSSINDAPGLGRKARIPIWYRPGTEADLTPPPMPLDELAQRGFDGYAIDYVECPEGLRWYLKRELNMHRTAISLRGIGDLQGAIDAVGRKGPNGRTANTNFVDRETVHQVSRSKYGNRELFSSTDHLPKARNFGGNTQVNPVEKQRIDDILQRCKQEAVEIHDEERENGMEAKRLEKVEAEHKAVVAAIDKRYAAIKAETTRKMKLEKKLVTVEQTLANALKKRNITEEGAKLRAEIVNLGKKRVKFISEAVECARDIITEQSKATSLGLQYFQIVAKKAALKELYDRKDAKCQTALREFNEIDAAYLESKKTAKALADSNQQMLLQLPAELRNEWEAITQAQTAYEKAVESAEQKGEDAPAPGDDVDLRSRAELQAELEKQEANLEMDANTNPGVVEQYEKRKRDIEVLEKTIEGRQRQANKIEKNIKNARGNWEPALQALVASIGKKFSAAFDRIGCAGEIRVRQDESYAQWAIDILVKFRDTEKLQLLTSQRQSGGERSLTTILYLMSLTEEARAPFSLVDEINQGMDQRAERMVHNSMVEVTCKPDSAQYFLITPKLLADLEYHERMKILCVNNGEWLPDEPGLGNMMSMLDGFLAKQ